MLPQYHDIFFYKELELIQIIYENTIFSVKYCAKHVFNSVFFSLF